MLDVARREVPGVHFVAADLASLPFPSSWFHVVISVHALQLASDPGAVLAEWRRVTNVGGRISLSVPGPRQALAMKIYDPIYRRHGMLRRVEVPTSRKLTDWARAAGWRQIDVVADPTTVIRLSGPDSFARWMRSGPRSDASRAMTRERFAELEADLLAVTPVGPDGRLRIPFGTLFLTARNP
jgi:SAM-dependent methyltransferase